MNPYDFVPVNWKSAPQRRRPAWHHRFAREGELLYSGQMEVDLKAETPIFILDSESDPHNPDKAATFIHNAQGNYIIPGSSMKGMLRCLVETLGNGCLTLFDGTYESRTVHEVHYEGKVEESFLRCNNHSDLCIACRIFGMLSQEKGGVFLGKVSIDDALAYPDEVYEYAPDSNGNRPTAIYTPVLAGPKPHHRAFYLERTGDEEYIAGRKYYFHHENLELPDEKEFRLSSNDVYLNQYILPLDYESRFHFRIDFTSLEKDEFAALLLAITLQPNMRHKIGYGKPIGLGSVHLIPTSLTLVDYASRYLQQDVKRGVSSWEGDDLQNLLSTKMEALNPEITRFIDFYLGQDAMRVLQRIWLWPPEKGVDYFYPEKSWFDKPANRGKHIKDTKSL